MTEDDLRNWSEILVILSEFSDLARMPDRAAAGHAVPLQSPPSHAAFAISYRV